MNWRLFLSRSWDETHAESEENRNQICRRRTRARIPDEIGHQPRADLALAMIDQLTDWGLAPPVVVADADYGENGTFRTALTTRGLEYIVQVKAAASMHPGDAVFEAPEYSGCGRPKKPGSRTKPIRAQVLAQSHPVSWRHGSRGTMTSRFATMRECVRRTGTYRGTRTGRCQRCGCWSNGPAPRSIPAITDCRLCPRTPASLRWSDWARFGGGSSMLTGNLSTSWAGITTRCW